MYRRYLKRFLDVFFSLIAIIILSPVFIVVGIIVFLQDYHWVIFKQTRVGRMAKLFTFYKFRSMPVNTPNVESSKVSQVKITPFGKIIRRTSIDELPQLFNILKGDMSIVGPRPPIPSQTRLIELRRKNSSLSCRPGLTGWAQINSYDFMPEEEKANFDGEYAKRISFSLDTQIILKTFLYLIKKPPTY